MKKNKVGRISLSGGLVGVLTTNPRRALEDHIEKSNQDGWYAIHIEPHSTTNLLIWLAQLTVLILTLGIWTWGAGYMVLFEKEV
jgi:hypothetical protein